jgi:deoxyadenosine/deoxycytidine kinase
MSSIEDTIPVKKIAIAGNIGSGKSHISELISGNLAFKRYAEKVNKDLLDLYYGDLTRYSFITQLFFTSSRIQDLIEILVSRESAVIDRYIDEDVEIFSKKLMNDGHMTREQFNFIKYLRDTAIDSVSQYSKLDLMIYLKTDVEVLKERIAKRVELSKGKRDNEKVLLQPGNTYLADLNRLYDEWYQGYDERIKGPKMMILTNDLKLANSEGKAWFNFGDIPKTMQKVYDVLYNQK